MQNFKFISLCSPYRFNFMQKRLIHLQPEAIVVAGAVRTPWGKYQGQLASVGALQLGQLAVDSAVKQSAVPLEHIQQIFMNERPKLSSESGNDFVFSDFLQKSKYVPFTTNDHDEPSMDSLLKGLECLQTQTASAVVVAGLESASHKENLFNKNQNIVTHSELFPEISSEIIENYINKSLVRYTTSQADGVFDTEIIPLIVKQQQENRRVLKEITQDEIFPENCREDNRTFQFSDGSAALVLTSFAKAQQWNLSPLAVITDFEYNKNSSNILSCTCASVENVLAKTKLNPKDITHWEIEDSMPEMVVHLKQHFDLSWNVINPNGGSLIMGHSSAASLLRLITHLAHNLNSSDYGCVISSNSQESLALVLQKLSCPTPPESLPLLTLYTKDPCPLCDTLIEELESNFSGEYDLQKVFIDSKENLRFLRLYRLDIPVLFLNNQFLCMHRLNHRLLRKKLDMLRNNK
ncbi:acetyl-CoA acetyltransferase, mitochondrial [Cochliomyia hominivorax]